MKKLLEVKNLSYSYDSGVKILDNINFTINKGDFACIVGKNGGGKTTLVRIILKIIKLKDYKQKVFFFTNSISFVPQENLIPKNFPCSAFEIIRSGLMAKKLKFFYNKEDNRTVLKLAKRLGIESLLYKQFTELSGGQKQKVLMARALIINPELLILDEATANMDKESEHFIFKYIKDALPNITVLMVSHNINTVSKFVNKVICIDKTSSMHEISKIDNRDYNLIIHEHCKMHLGE